MFVYCHLELVAADVPELAREFHRRFASDHSLAHGEEVVALAGLASPAHLRSDPTAAKLRQNRMPVRCCQYTFDLLVKYLHVANQMALLSILNARVAVTVTDGDPAPEADEAACAARSTITGIGPPSFVDAFNAKKSSCRWGVLEQSVEGRAREECEEERARAEKEEGDGDDEKDAKPMSKRSKAAAEKARREAEEKERLEQEAGGGRPGRTSPPSSRARSRCPSSPTKRDWTPWRTRGTAPSSARRLAKKCRPSPSTPSRTRMGS